ncbi:MAG: HAD-IA family hydrolase [Bacillota bacterium]
MFDPVIFDMDGTLVDSFEAILLAFNHAMEKMGRPKVTHDELLPVIGVALKDIFRLYLPEERVGEAVDHYRTYQAGIILQRTRVLDGVLLTLQELFKMGVTMGVVTNKPVDVALRVLDHVKLGRFFGAVVGVDEVSRPKPDPEGLYLCLSRLGKTAAQCLYVGDSHIDMDTALAAGVEFRLVPTGAVGADDLRRRAKQRVISGLPELLECYCRNDNDCSDQR